MLVVQGLQALVSFVSLEIRKYAQSPLQQAFQPFHFSQTYESCPRAILLLMCGRNSIALGYLLT